MQPDTFFASFGQILDEVPPQPGEEALYDWFRVVLAAAETDPHVAAACRQAALDADVIVKELFEFRNYGIPVAHNWTTQNAGARRADASPTGARGGVVAGAHHHPVRPRGGAFAPLSATLLGAAARAWRGDTGGRRAKQAR